MCPEPSSLSGRQTGFAIVAAIFILVVLAGLGAYMVTVSSAHHMGSAIDIQGSRALQAARSGMDWGISRVVGASSCAATTHLSTGAGGDFPVLSGFTITVECTDTPYTDGPDALHSYQLTATACNQPTAGGACPNTDDPSMNYIERRLTVQVVM